ncbi:hypothetical protein GCM10012275_50180 [Longimycelium tulufanense]|uniref:Uncharacterized protein n=1 Tax=Longimycelium tulufanense TaxID=907463 RepID=A0A8J3FXD6_9PSEU|nr:DUF6328 family protein [Longimycelium tulufanense]GGM73476.1 hypothetical protein GCM10012275_50180 [Longimycelium tulufanense]
MSTPEPDVHQRLARNLNELLQELRVAVAGVQILFAFLLAVTFTEAFREATAFQRGTHLVTVLLATGSTVLLITPAAWHRLLFRYGRRQEILRAANGFAVSGLALLAAAMTGTVLLVADVILGGWVAALLAVLVGAAFGLLWFLLPLRLRLHRRPHD